MSVLSTVTRRYLLDFTFRLAVFIAILLVYFTQPLLLDFTVGRPNWALTLLWLAVLLSMVVQLSPRSGLTTGCMKQYPTGCDPDPCWDEQQLRQAVHRQNRGAFKVAAVWISVNLGFGLLYCRGVLRTAELVLLCALYYLCDLICVLFFCPFQTFLMKNSCCVNCRIFAWGSWMMAAPMWFVSHPYARSLVIVSILVLICWEWRFFRHPERFWSGSNRRLRCSSCQEQLCRYKHPRSPRFRQTP